MEFKKPKLKRKFARKGKLKVPLKSGKDIVGIFNGEFVTISDINSMHYLYQAGNFGKGSLSKGEPNYHIKKDDIPKIMLECQFENQTKWKASRDYSCHRKYSESVSNDINLSLRSVSDFLQSSFNNEEKLRKFPMKTCIQESKNFNKKFDVSLLEFKTELDYEDESFRNFVNNILQSRQMRVPNTSNFTLDEVIVLGKDFKLNDFESSLVCSNARLEKLTFGPKECLILNLEESLFLKSKIGSLNIVDLNFSEIPISDLWRKFHAMDKNFIERYATYHSCRDKGWIVKSGLKFGGDYLLYKDGPAYYHASYLVKILDKKKKLTWTEFVAMNRLVETFNKDLLLSNVLQIKTSSNDESFPEVLKNYSVQKVLVRRWFPTKERLPKEDNTFT